MDLHICTQYSNLFCFCFHWQCALLWYFLEVKLCWSWTMQTHASFGVQTPGLTTSCHQNGPYVFSFRSKTERSTQFTVLRSFHGKKQAQNLSMPTTITTTIIIMTTMTNNGNSDKPLKRRARRKNHTQICPSCSNHAEAFLVSLWWNSFSSLTLGCPNHSQTLTLSEEPNVNQNNLHFAFGVELNPFF